MATYTSNLIRQRAAGLSMLETVQAMAAASIGSMPVRIVPAWRHNLDLSHVKSQIWGC